MKASLSLLNYSLILLLIGGIFCGCNKYGGPYEDLKTGKYEATVYKTYPSGSKDTLKYTVYGPKKFYDNLSFEGTTYGIYQSGWGIYNKDNLYYNSGLGTGNATYKITGIEHSKTVLTVYFVPFSPPQPDSAYGKVIFNYVEL